MAFMIYTRHQYYSSDKIKEEKTGGACGTYGGE
jgi:hypothetical protein